MPWVGHGEDAMGGRGTTTETDDSAEAASLFHDLRQYVAAGLMLAGMQGVHELDAETGRRLETIAHVFEGIKDLLEENSGVRRSTPVDLTAVARECVEFTRLVSKVPIDAVLRRPIQVMANHSLLHRAVLNVLNNATRAAGVGGRVRVGVGRLGGDAWVEVSDDGAGFGRIPVVQGMGMAVVEATVRSAGGSLEIYSGPTPGTRVRLRLPRPQIAAIRP